MDSSLMAEGMGFEPMRGVSPPNRLAGGRTKPLCDPSLNQAYYNRRLSAFSNIANGTFMKQGTIEQQVQQIAFSAVNWLISSGKMP